MLRKIFGDISDAKKKISQKTTQGAEIKSIIEGNILKVFNGNNKVLEYISDIQVVESRVTIRTKSKNVSFELQTRKDQLSAGLNSKFELVIK